MTDDEFAVHALVVNTIFTALLKQHPALRADVLAMLNGLRNQTNYAGMKEQATIDEAVRAINAL